MLIYYFKNLYDFTMFNFLDTKLMQKFEYPDNLSVDFKSI